MVGAAHREEKVKPLPPQVDVELIGHHVAGRLDIGDEEHVLIRRAVECDARQAAHGAAGAVATGHPRGGNLAERSVRVLQRGRHRGVVLRQADQLGVPLHLQVPLGQVLAQDPFVVVLSENEEIGIGAHIAPDVAQGNTGGATSIRPEVGAGRAAAECECAIGDAKPGVDLEGAGLHAEGA